MLLSISHGLSQGISIYSKWKISRTNKNINVSKKAKFKSNFNVTLRPDITGECLYHWIFFPSCFSQKALKALGLSHCGTESLLKSQGKKMPGVEESSWTQLCQMLDWKLHLYVLPLCLGIFFHAWWLCMSEPWALLWQHIKPFSGRNQGVVTSAYNRKALLHKACGAASPLCLSKTIMNNKFSGSFLHL